MITTIFQPENGNYHLYLECMYVNSSSIYIAGGRYHHRFFPTLKDALKHVNEDILSVPNNFLWRLERLSDGKNFTNKIYSY